MKITLKPFIYKNDFIFGETHTEFTPTGRWKLVTAPGVTNNTLFLEHQGPIFRKWVHEDDIIFYHVGIYVSENKYKCSSFLTVTFENFNIYEFLFFVMVGWTLAYFFGF